MLETPCGTSGGGERDAVVQAMLAKARRWRLMTLKSLGRSPTVGELRLCLGASNQEVAEALAGAFADVPRVEAVAGNLLDADCVAIVSPANSFGDMGGGIDKAIVEMERGVGWQRVDDGVGSWFAEMGGTKCQITSLRCCSR